MTSHHHQLPFFFPNLFQNRPVLHSFYKTHCDTRSVEALLTAFVVPQPSRVTIKRLIKRV
jgi:hypothetical protein